MGSLRLSASGASLPSVKSQLLKIKTISRAMIGGKISSECPNFRGRCRASRRQKRPNRKNPTAYTNCPMLQGPILDAEQTRRFALLSAAIPVHPLSQRPPAVVQQITASVNCQGQLDPQIFLRIHRQAIVNLNHIREIGAYDKHSARLTLTGGHEAVVGRSYLKTLRQILQW